MKDRVRLFLLAAMLAVVVLGVVGTRQQLDFAAGFECAALLALALDGLL